MKHTYSRETPVHHEDKQFIYLLVWLKQLYRKVFYTAMGRVDKASIHIVLHNM